MWDTCPVHGATHPRAQARHWPACHSLPCFLKLSPATIRTGLDTEIIWDRAEAARQQPHPIHAAKQRICTEFRWGGRVGRRLASMGDEGLWGSGQAPASRSSSAWAAPWTACRLAAARMRCSCSLLGRGSRGCRPEGLACPALGLGPCKAWLPSTDRGYWRGRRRNGSPAEDGAAAKYMLAGARRSWNKAISLCVSPWEDSIP